MKLLLVGIGHSLRGDDAAGLEAVRAWQRHHVNAHPRAGLDVELVESPGIELADLLSSFDKALLVDAVRSGAVAGTLHVLSANNVLRWRGTFGPMHGWGVAEVVRLATALRPGRIAQDLRFLGIEAAQMHLGTPMSAAVRNALPAAAAAIETELQSLSGKYPRP